MAEKKDDLKERLERVFGKVVECDPNATPSEQERELRKLKKFLREGKDCNEDVFLERYAKEGLLKEYFGYRTLYVPGGMVRIEDCQDVRIGRVFLERRKHAQRRILSLINQLGYDVS